MKQPIAPSSSFKSGFRNCLKRVTCAMTALAFSTLFTGCYFSLEKPFTSKANCETTPELNGVWKSSDGMKYLSVEALSGNSYEIRERSFDEAGTKTSERLIASFPYEIGFRHLLVSVDGGTRHFGEVSESTLEASGKSKGKWGYLLFSLHEDGNEMELALLDINEENNSSAGVREALGNLHTGKGTSSMGNWQKTTLAALPSTPSFTDLIAFQAAMRKAREEAAERQTRTNQINAGVAAIRRVMTQLNNELANARNGNRDQQVAAYARISGINVAGSPADFQAVWRPFATTSGHLSTHLSRLPSGGGEAFIEGALYGLLDETDSFIELSKQRIADTINLSDRLNFQLNAVRSSANQIRVAR